jgi:hypothetical protein
LKYTLNGDANFDGVVNSDDFSIMAAHFGKQTSNGWEQGDFNYDGVVNGNDFGVLAANFGKSANTAPPGLSLGAGTQYTLTGVPGAETLDITSGTVTFTSDLFASLSNYSLKIESGAHVILASNQHLGQLQLIVNGILDAGSYSLILNYGIGSDPKSGNNILD